MSIRACKKRSYGSVTKEEEFNQHNGTKEATRFLEKNLWEHHRTNILTYCEGEKIHKHQQNLDEEESSKHDTEGKRKKKSATRSFLTFDAYLQYPRTRKKRGLGF